MTTASLHGLRILNTRPKQQAHTLSQEIIQAGGISIELPLLEIIPTAKYWIDSLPDLNTIDLALFISAHAVSYCFKQLKQQHIHWPKSIKIIAIGEGTAKALESYGVKRYELPAQANSEQILTMDCLRELKNQSMLLFKGENGRAVIEEGLIARGATVLSISVYKRVLPDLSYEFIQNIWHNDLVDIILLTSQQSIDNLFHLFCKEAHPWLQGKPCVVLSERLARAAAARGIKKMIMSSPSHMVDALLDTNLSRIIHEQ